MSSGNKFIKIRTRLWHRFNGRCENCGVCTILPEKIKGDAPPNMATIQHKYHRLHPMRRLKAEGERVLLLWCLTCNKNYQVEYEKDISHLNSMQLDSPKRFLEISDQEINEAWKDDFDFGEYYNRNRHELINNLLLHVCMRGQVGTVGGIGKKLLMALGLLSPYNKITLKGKDYLLTTLYIRKNENKL